MSRRPTITASSDDGFRDSSLGIYAKIHKTSGKTIIASCDADISGKKIKDNKIEMYIDPYFYGKENVNTREFDEMLLGANSLNVVGKKIVEYLLIRKIIEKEHILFIGDVPHVQVYFL